MGVLKPFTPTRISMDNVHVCAHEIKTKKSILILNVRFSFLQQKLSYKSNTFISNRETEKSKICQHFKSGKTILDMNN